MPETVPSSKGSGNAGSANTGPGANALDSGLIEKVVGGILKLPRGHRCVVGGLYGSAKAYFVGRLLRESGRTVLVAAPNQEQAETLQSDIEFFLGKENVLYYPSTETLPYETQTPHPELRSRRMEFLLNLARAETPYAAVATASDLAERVIPKSALLERSLKISLGEELPLDQLGARLARMGYARMSMVEERGEVSVRGGIMDIFPPVWNHPLRIEFIGNEVESIRTFDISTQRSQRELDEVVIAPFSAADFSEEARRLARERLLDRVEEMGIERDVWEPVSNRLRDGVELEAMDGLLPFFYDRLDTVFDYLPEDTIIVLPDRSAMDAALEKFHTEIEQHAEKKNTFVRPEEFYMSKDEFQLAFDRFIGVETRVEAGFEANAATEAVAFEIPTRSNLDLRQDISIKKNLGPLRERLHQWRDQGESVYLTAHNRGQAERMRELLDGFRVDIVKGREIVEAASGMDRRVGLVVETPVRIALGSLSTGFRIPGAGGVGGAGLTIVTEEEVFGERIKRRGPPSRRADALLTELRDLNVGDPVVHTIHGIGLYRGLKRFEVEGVTNDFLLLEYRDSDRLFLPVQRMDQVNKYHGLEDHMPQIDKLGGPGWAKTKGLVKKAVRQIAGELLRLYAAREASKGYSFQSPGALFTEFEAGFEFDETPDQTRAIDEVSADMSSERPMDRLICGDVGYGKTEVAMRAAFRAVLDSKQVAILVPTTVLAQQHLLTLGKRFAPFPVTIEVLSRFRSRSEQTETIERTAAGKTDILIGTHRLLQKDVSFKDLGLVVIDEEHRFGVRHKERLKEMKKEVDVMTLTATPIPRTLQMSLSYIRDLSIINTPPEDRLAISTRVIRFDEEVMREAMEREIKRGGQVFFVHNRVQSIDAMHELVKGLVPDARTAVAHGQMKERDLERVMLEFAAGDYDILLCTTIIESGLDIPTANTIIINRADRFGLAELYQMRGRVGRSKHRAYAYLVTPDESALTGRARKRIDVIRELSELGSGFRVAAYDLEIRGAGELLGQAQSGRIAEVGIDLYTQLLEEAVAELKGESPPIEAEPEINLKISQFIPDEYVPDTRQRLNFYKRLASAATHDVLDAISAELDDRFGRAPEVVENLLETIRLKLLLKRIGALELAQKGGRLYLAFDESKTAAKSAGAAAAGRAIELARERPEGFSIVPGRQGSKLVYRLKPGAGVLDEARFVLQELADGC